MKIKLLILSLLILSSSAFASDEILLRDNFLKSSLGLSEVPMHSYIILKDDIEEGVNKILKDTYHLPVIKYWRSGKKVGFILEAIGKHEFITTGFTVEDNKISDAKVLVYRENYGYEIKYDMFINQIEGNSLKGNGKLVGRIANISGATLSVNSMRKLSKLSLFLYSKI
jgi:hypothetical protein|tara:strand:+ start:64 stop:570 length:507 start_codon:yes stop_codon:yes gene_type:complete